ncbi:hypothetical protein Bhyg_13929 [Pseudolycoriella hygida]|uniref:C-type lectin domain-containing protein n=1 Tax=Pseudolycoriella hygida TaxID=35572 RepID=A0A9Q0MR09_9DIPT|nr:hypothetical protein Bhyg_13929 [Pseudolycoriella hygida]
MDMTKLQVSWYAANEFCLDSGMKLASVTSLEEHQSIEKLIKDKYITDQQFWISKSKVALKSACEQLKTQTIPAAKFSSKNSINQCITWYWMNVELCLGLWPLTNRWNHENCREGKYFICERDLESEAEMLNLIRDELLTLVDESMFTGFADALHSTTESTWVSFVENALEAWLMEQQQIGMSTTNLLLDKQVSSIASELALTEITFGTDEVKEFVHTKYDMINDEERVRLMNERFIQFIGDEYMSLVSGSNWRNTPTDDDVNALVRKVLMLAKVQEIKLANEELAKFSETASSDVLDEDLFKSISQQLLKYSENEFELYALDVVAALENYDVEEVDINILFQLYVLVKQELFSLIAKTVLRATTKERLEIVSYALSRILEGKELTEEESVFGQIFVLLGTGTAVLSNSQGINALDDVLLRKFVKKEIQELRPEDMSALVHEGYIKFVMDEVIKLEADIDLAKSDSGELIFKNVVDLIRSQLLYYGEDELKTIAQRLAEFIEEETNKLLTTVEDIKVELGVYSEEKVQKLMESIQRELLTITIQSLISYEEKEMLALAERGLSKILDEDRPIGKSSLFRDIFVTIRNELLNFTKDEFDVMDETDFMNLVKWETEQSNYEVSLVVEEFIKLIEDDAIISAAHEEDTNRFEEIVRLLANNLFVIANSGSVYIKPMTKN